jgi:molecular chaperone DnaK
LERQRLQPDDISDVLLVGGSTLTPKVYQTVEDFFGKAKVRRNINPMECVALGAGILAGTQRGVECVNCSTVNEESATECASCKQSLATARPAGDTNVYDVTGMALGVAAVQGAQADTFVPIIPRGTPYNPMTEPMRRTFEATDGRRIRVPVYEGDDPVASHNYEQGVVEFELPEEIDVHTRVDVEFRYDKDRILNVTISVPGTAIRHQTKLRTDTQRENSPAVAEQEEDGATFRQDLAFTVEITQNFLRRYEQYLEPSQAMKISGDLERANRTLTFSDPAECRWMTSVLQSDIFGSGLASDLYFAERAADQASQADAEQINQAIAEIRKSHQQGRREAAVEQARVLKPLLARVGQQYDVAEIGDAKEFDGLLKLLES